MVKYSVIIPIYNSEKYLEECIESVVLQNREDIEIILINDGSKDNSLSICNKFKSNYNNIIVINKLNSGTTDTILNGIKEAKGEYICFIDSDDTISSNYFNTLDKYTKEKYDIIIFDFLKKFKNCSIKTKVNNISYGKLKDNEVENLQKNYFDNFNNYSLYRWDKVIKKDIIQKSASEIKIKAIYFEDHIISFLNLLNANTIFYIEENLYFYRMRGNSVSHQVNDRIFKDLLDVEKEMENIAHRYNYDEKQFEKLRLYFLYQYARFSLKNKEKTHNKKVSWQDVVKTKTKSQKVVLILYKLNLNKIYKLLLDLKKKKENGKKKDYFE